MFACIYIPDFPAEAIVRTTPLLREQAVAVLEGKPPMVRVVALNEKARLLGMEAGMTKMQAAVFAGPAEKAPPIAKTKEKKSAHIELASRRTMGKPKLGPAALRQRSAEQENSAHAA